MCVESCWSLALYLYVKQQERHNLSLTLTHLSTSDAKEPLNWVRLTSFSALQNVWSFALRCIPMNCTQIYLHRTNLARPIIGWYKWLHWPVFQINFSAFEIFPSFFWILSWCWIGKWHSFSRVSTGLVNMLYLCINIFFPNYRIVPSAHWLCCCHIR